MTDQNVDIQTLLTAMEQKFEAKLSARETEFQKQLDIQANKIHSSYQKKFGKQTQEVDEDDDSPSRRPTKHELKLQADIERLIKKSDEAELKAALAAQKNTFVKTALEKGFNPDAIDTVYTLQNARGAFVQDGEGGFKMKTSIEGMEVTLPLADALTKYSQTNEAKLFLAPKGAAGSGASTSTSTSSTSATTPANKTPIYKDVSVNWGAVTENMINGGD